MGVPLLADSVSTRDPPAGQVEAATFVLGERLGYGGQGVVWKAQWLDEPCVTSDRGSLEQAVAVKIYRDWAGLETDDDHLREYRLQARRRTILQTKRLRGLCLPLALFLIDSEHRCHKWIPDFGLRGDDGRVQAMFQRHPALRVVEVNEFVPGRRLDRHNTTYGERSPVHVLARLRPLRTVAQALLHLGLEHLPYRDMKAENIIVRSGGDGSPGVLIDLGTIAPSAAALALRAPYYDQAPADGPTKDLYGFACLIVRQILLLPLPRGGVSSIGRWAFSSLSEAGAPKAVAQVLAQQLQPRPAQRGPRTTPVDLIEHVISEYEQEHERARRFRLGYRRRQR